VESLAERLLAYVRKHPGQTFAFDRLTKLLKTDRGTLDKAAAQLMEWGYRLRVRGSKGIAFIRATDQMTETEVSYQLSTRVIGKQILAFRTVQSTNDIAATQAEHGAPEGTIVVADQQTKGRGRLGRTWFSSAGTGIYLSIVLKPKFPPEDAPGLSLLTALALAETLEKTCKGGVRIKWPNDVLLGGRKVAGILTELSADRNRIAHVIVGVGVNVNHGAGHFPDDLRETATSVRLYQKRKVDRVALLKRFLTNFEREYTDYKKYRLKKAHRRLRRFSSLLGVQVTVLAGQSRITGIARDIDDHGRLVIEAEGNRHTITAGEVTVAKS
ncbi:MAG: biotin--[acetyl-CoA-carboxylase] ligase, partial [candidate division Zixibacteria bacterium]|nr:biotin--[acetyl-CoA-carboxylase] ligase [candidate division Zixibacteria bacterium]